MAKPKELQTKAPSQLFNPSLRQEDQEDAMQELPQVEVIGPPGYASPDPATSTGLLLPIEDHPLSGDISEDYGANVANPAEVTATGTLTAIDGDDDGEVKDVSKADDSWTKKDWQAAAKSRGVGQSGSIADIKDRIKEYDKEEEKRQEEVDAIKNMSREELDELAAEYDIDADTYSRADLLEQAVLAASRGEEVPVGDKADNDA
jgi:hypothetical protein